MKAVYFIVIAGTQVPVLQNDGKELTILNSLVLLLPGHIQVEKMGEDDLSINDVWDIQKALSKQNLNKPQVLREDVSSNDFDEVHVK